MITEVDRLNKEWTLLVGIGYTLATGRLFCPMPDLQAYAERLLNRPVMTHEFALPGTWDELRVAFETKVRDGS